MLSSPRVSSQAEIRQEFRMRVERRDALLLPGGANALTARIIEDLGFEAVYLTGAGLANTHLGMPDLGLVSVTELAETAARISDVCRLPLVVDIDTGFGSALNVYRTVRLLERAGAAALQIEDQIFPKKCGHFADKSVVPLPEMVNKIKAALDARGDANTLVVARTDARAVEGIEQAIERAHAMTEAGADVGGIAGGDGGFNRVRFRAFSPATRLQGARNPDPVRQQSEANRTRRSRLGRRSR